MKISAGKGNSVGESNTPKQRETSFKSGGIGTYLSSHYKFRYNTILGRTEYKCKDDTHSSKVDCYEINTLQRKIDNDIRIATSSDNPCSVIEGNFPPRINPTQEYFRVLPLLDIGSNCGNVDEYNSCYNVFSLSLKAIPELASCVATHNHEK